MLCSSLSVSISYSNALTGHSGRLKILFWSGTESAISILFCFEIFQLPIKTKSLNYLLRITEIPLSEIVDMQDLAIKELG